MLPTDIKENNIEMESSPIRKPTKHANSPPPIEKRKLKQFDREWQLEQRVRVRNGVINLHKSVIQRLKKESER